MSTGGSDSVLWYDNPAAEWLEALPIGNGQLGAMVFGGVTRERIGLNLDTLWSGGPRTAEAGAVELLPELRRLVVEEHDYPAADAVARQMQGPYNESYQPLGDLRLEFDHRTAARAYRRDLDLDRAVSGVRYQVGDTTFTRELFVSAPDRVLVVRLEADRPGSVSFSMRLDSPHPVRTAASGSVLTMTGRAPQHVAPNYHDEERSIVYAADGGMRFEAQVEVVAAGGRVTARSDSIEVKAADSVTLLLSAATSFSNYRDDPAKSTADLAAICRGIRAAAASYPELRDRHVADHQELFRRVRLDLGGASDRRPTDRRIAAVRAGTSDPGLVALYFQYGRYLLISSSRPGSQAANLQGIWNDQVRPPWSSNWTTNINTEMNYWPAEVTNLAECHEPMFDLVEELAVAGQRTARDWYGARGWVVHHNTDVWRSSWPVGGGTGDPVWTCWPMAGVWMCQHLWEHYAFTGDRGFLAGRAYPVLRDAATFVLDFLVEDGSGHLVTCPSTSPENLFLTADGTRAAVSAASTLDMWLIRDLFTHCIAAAAVLDRDAEFAAELARTLDRLWVPQIAPDGRLQEWWEDVGEAEPGHRHLSHLWSVYPGEQATGAVLTASRRALDHRLANGGGGTGWSRAWVVALAARFGDADLAVDSLRILLAESTAPNMFDLHPPDLFQIDGNFGASAGIAEMLLQSHGGVIALLPALPNSWATGSVEGLRARGDVTVDIEWSAGSATEATLRTAGDASLFLRPPPGQTIGSIRDAAGTSVEITAAKGVARFDAAAGEYRVSFD
ncbi:MAG TPA: glycoside hydrolase family 95 protein [Mycobacteriales bacterium]|nr:glycoside hydrolase family 95 protein [Mycobacteriales bacterium]